MVLREWASSCFKQLQFNATLSVFYPSAVQTAEREADMQMIQVLDCHSAMVAILSS